MPSACGAIVGGAGDLALGVHWCFLFGLARSAARSFAPPMLFRMPPEGGREEKHPVRRLLSPGAKSTRRGSVGQENKDHYNTTERETNDDLTRFPRVQQRKTKK